MTRPDAPLLLPRRDLLRGLAATAALPLLANCGGYEKLPSPNRPGSRLDSIAGSIDPYLDITNGNTGDHMALRFADNGRVHRRAKRQLNWMFRDWRENKDPEIDERLFWGLAAISNRARQQGHSGQVTLLSGFRSKKTNDSLRSEGAAKNSFHVRRRAMDIRVQGMGVDELGDYAEWLQVGGVGRYYGSNFVHVDSGNQRTWTG